MKRLDEQLQRLLRAAAAAPAAPVGELSFAVESRVLSAWRQRDVGGELAALIGLFRRGLMLASVVAVAVAFVSWQSAQEPVSLTNAEVAAADSVLRLALAP